jgi:hypothetical protein
MEYNGNRWRATVNSVLNLQVQKNAGKLLSAVTTGGILSSAQLHSYLVHVLFIYLHLTHSL